MATHTLLYPNQAFEDELYPPGGCVQFDGFPPWNGLDSRLYSSVKDCHDDGASNAIGHYSFISSSYDRADHGFALAQPVKRPRPLNFPDWHEGYLGYPSPASSSTSLSGAGGSKDHSVTPETPKESHPFFIMSGAAAYPSPHPELYGKPSHHVHLQLSSVGFDYGSPLRPSQPSFSMRDFELRPDELPCLGNLLSPESLSNADNNKLEDTRLHAHAADQAESLENGDCETRRVDAEMADYEAKLTQAKPHPRTRRLAGPTTTATTATATPSVTTTKTTHAVQDSKAHVSKPISSRAKSKAKATRQRHSSKIIRTAAAAADSVSKPSIRSFRCPFAAFGCASVFPTKNEWKRHTAAQHLQLGFYRCDLGGCSLSHPDQVTLTRGHNDFNRKDLFTQHCRRMHWDECEGLQRSKIKGREWASWSNREKNIFESFMEKVRTRCWINRRGPPSQSECSVCGKAFTDDDDDDDNDDDGLAENVDGARAWEERMEHVGKHYEKGEQDKRRAPKQQQQHQHQLAEEQQDVGLRKWCEENEMGVWIDGRYWLLGYEPEAKGATATSTAATTTRRMGRSARGNQQLAAAGNNDLGCPEEKHDDHDEDDDSDDDTDADGEPDDEE